MRNFTALIFLLVSLLLLAAGCAGQKYVWNESSGKAHEGRCHTVNPDGTLGQIVASEKCGR